MFYVFFSTGHVAIGTSGTYFDYCGLCLTLAQHEATGLCKSFTDMADARAYSLTRKNIQKYGLVGFEGIKPDRN
jgi:hypothetical protein